MIHGHSLVLSQLTKHPFELLATTLKVALLMAFLSVFQATEFTALRWNLPYIIFSHTDITYLPKMVSHFPMSHLLISHTFYPLQNNLERSLLGCQVGLGL